MPVVDQRSGGEFCGDGVQCPLICFGGALAAGPTGDACAQAISGDAEAIFLGKLETMYGVGQTGEMRGAFSGSVGFVLD